MRRFFGVGALVIGVVVIGLMALTKWWTGPQLAATMSMPERVFVNQRFSIFVDITNPHPDSVEFDNLEMPLEILDMVDITASTPAPNTSSPFNVFGLRVWKFNAHLAPGQSLRLELRAKAKTAAEDDIVVGICNAYEECTRVSKRIRIVHEFLESPNR